MINQLWLLWEQIINVQDESLSDEHSECSNYSSSMQTGENEVDDSCCKYGCYHTVRKTFPPVNFWASGLVEK